MYNRLKSFRVFIAFIAVFGTALTVVSQADAQVVLTEVDYHNDLIEMVNMGASPVDIGGWQLCSRFSYREISTLTVVEGSTNLEPDGILVLSGFPLNDARADLGLYTSRSFGSATAMQSFVEWGGSPNGRETVAVRKGIWDAGDFVPPVPNGHSIAYDGVRNSAAAWLVQETPNFGAFEISVVFGVTLEIAGEASQSMDNPIAGVTYTLTVTNTGNQGDTINLSAAPEVGVEGVVRGALSESLVALDAGASAEITLNVTGDAFTESGDYEVKVIATSAGDSSATAEVMTATTFEIPLPPTPWDVNRDGVVNVFDLVLVGGEFGESGTDRAGDVNADGIVNIFDLVTVADHFGEMTGLAAQR